MDGEGIELDRASSFRTGRVLHKQSIETRGFGKAGAIQLKE